MKKKKSRSPAEVLGKGKKLSPRTGSSLVPRNMKKKKEEKKRGVADLTPKKGGQGKTMIKEGKRALEKKRTAASSAEKKEKNARSRGRMENEGTASRPLRKGKGKHSSPCFQPSTPGKGGGRGTTQRAPADHRNLGGGGKRKEGRSEASTPKKNRKRALDNPLHHSRSKEKEKGGAKRLPEHGPHQRKKKKGRRGFKDSVHGGGAKGKERGGGSLRPYSSPFTQEGGEKKKKKNRKEGGKERELIKKKKEGESRAAGSSAEQKKKGKEEPVTEILGKTPSKKKKRRKRFPNLRHPRGEKDHHHQNKKEGQKHRSSLPPFEKEGKDLRFKGGGRKKGKRLDPALSPVCGGKKKRVHPPRGVALETERERISARTEGKGQSVPPKSIRKGGGPVRRGEGRKKKAAGREKKERKKKRGGPQSPSGTQEARLWRNGRKREKGGQFSLLRARRTPKKEHRLSMTHTSGLLERPKKRNPRTSGTKKKKKKRGIHKVKQPEISKEKEGGPNRIRFRHQKEPSTEERGGKNPSTSFPSPGKGGKKKSRRGGEKNRRPPFYFL